METTETFEEALAKFIEVAQEKVTKEREPNTKLLTTVSPVYVRVFARRNNDERFQEAFCFVEVKTGNVLKAAGWKAPEKKNPRSNIYSPDHGASGISAYGAVGLRRGY
jgi:hypothetical protein